MTRKAWKVAGLPDSYSLDPGDPVPCCGCPVGMVTAVDDAWRSCGCHCHETARRHAPR